MQFERTGLLRPARTSACDRDGRADMVCTPGFNPRTGVRRPARTVTVRGCGHDVSARFCLMLYQTELPTPKRRAGFEPATLRSGEHADFGPHLKTYPVVFMRPAGHGVAHPPLGALPLSYRNPFGIRAGLEPATTRLRGDNECASARQAA